MTTEQTYREALVLLKRVNELLKPMTRKRSQSLGFEDMVLFKCWEDIDKFLASEALAVGSKDEPEVDWNEVSHIVGRNGFLESEKNELKKLFFLTRKQTKDGKE